MIALSLTLLGPFQASLAGQPLTHFRTKSVQALLVFLAVEPRSHSREFLAELLFPGLPPASSLKNLRQSLYELRRIVPDPSPLSPFFLIDRHSIQLNPEVSCNLDISSFTTLSTSTDPDSLAAAVSLYRGDFLQDFSLPNCAEFDAWCLLKRSHYRSILLDTLDRLVDLCLQSGDLSRARPFARQLFDLDDLREPSLRRWMTVLALSGERSAALSAFHSFQERLLLDLQVSPSPESTTLFERIRSGELRLPQPATLSPPAPVAAPVIPHNLPAQLTPFIGRKSELSDIQLLLSDPAVRLVNLLGQGGSGKTRLALATAEACLTEPSFSHGVFFIPLAGVSESERILPVIAEALNLNLQQGEDQLLAFLRSKRMLLILDNFEHLLEAAGILLRLLQAAPQLKLLVTSRQRLLLHGEHAYPIQGLHLDHSASIDDARLLFLQSAQRILPDFHFTPGNLADLKRLCLLVEGLPLALELAAAWIDLLSPADIVAEIQHSLDFLHSDLRDLPERHRSMTAVFDTAWLNLPLASQKILTQVSVFRGGFSRQAARAVTGADLRDLKTLVDKSLLSFDPASQHYHIHELLRQYCLARLEQIEVFDRHRAYFFDWLIQQSSLLTSGDQEAAAGRIEVDMDNIRAAINQALESHSLDRLDQVVQTLNLFYIIRNHHQEGVMLYSRILDRLTGKDEAPADLMFWLTALKVNFLGILGRADEDWELWPQCQALFKKLSKIKSDVRKEQAFLDYVEGFHLYNKKPEEAQRLFHRSYELTLDMNDRWFAGWAIMGEGRAARNQGNLAKAEAAIKTSQEIFQALDYSPGVAQARRMLGNLAGIAGRYVEAERIIQEGMNLSRKINQVWEVANGGLDKLRMVYFFSGRFEDALAPNAEYLSLSTEYGYTWGVIQHHIAQGLLNLHLGQYPEALEFGDTAVQLARGYNQVQFLCEALILLTQTALVQEHFELARKHLEECDRHCPARVVGMSLYVAGSHLYWGILEGVTGQQAAGQDHLRIELQAAFKRKDELNLANAVALGALLEAVKGNGLAALELYALACQHPFIAHSTWFKDVVGARIEHVAQELPPEAVRVAQARGTRLDLWTKAEQILAGS